MSTTIDSFAIKKPPCGLDASIRTTVACPFVSLKGAWKPHPSRVDSQMDYRMSLWTANTVVRRGDDI